MYDPQKLSEMRASVLDLRIKLALCAVDPVDYPELAEEAVDLAEQLLEALCSKAEDEQDLKDAREALIEALEQGLTSLEDLKKELDS
jgi:hypothetical protein